MKLQAFEFTVSVKGDLSKETITAIVSYCKKKCLYSFVALETGESGKLHLHAAIVLKVAAEGNDVVGNWWKHYVQPHHPDSIRSKAIKKHAMIDHDWYDRYLLKENDVRIELDSYNREEVSKFFPTEEEQQMLMDHVVEGTTDKRSRHGRLLAEWTEHDPEDASYASAITFLKYSMYVSETLEHVQDHRYLRQLAYHLYEYRNKITQPDEADLQFYRNQTEQLSFKP